MAASLVAMTVRSSSAVADRAALLTELDRLRHEALAVVDADRVAYEAVLAARGQRDVDTEAFRAAVAGANRPPLEITRIATSVATQAQVIAATSNPELRGDLTTGVILADAAATAATELVAANTDLGALDDDDLRRAQDRRARIRGHLTAFLDARGGDGGAPGVGA